jgi:hypothetical protein
MILSIDFSRELVFDVTQTDDRFANFQGIAIASQALEFFSNLQVLPFLLPPLSLSAKLS